MKVAGIPFLGAFIDEPAYQEAEAVDLKEDIIPR